MVLRKKKKKEEIQQEEEEEFEEEETEEEDNDEPELPPMPAVKPKKQTIAPPSRAEIADMIEGNLIRAVELTRLLRSGQ